MHESPFVDAQLHALQETSLTGAATVTVVVLDQDDALSALTVRSLYEGYAVTRASLAEHGLHGLAEVVRILAERVEIGTGRGRKRGLVAVLEGFAKKHGRGALDVFDSRAREAGLVGEMRRLCRDVIESIAQNTSVARLERWLALERPLDAGTGPAIRLLGPATAKSTLAGLTRVMRVVGARATLVILDHGEALVDLSPARRELATTVLRELIDNSDGIAGATRSSGMTAAKLLVCGYESMLTRKHGLLSHEALATRIATREPNAWPSPHATLAKLTEPPHRAFIPDRAASIDGEARNLRALLRLGQGLPPTEALDELTVGLDEVDRRIDQLFATSANDGSVFAVLSGAYGSGKTHHLLHLEARALASKRPVLRLAVERLDEDMGNPQRHLRRLLEGTIIPVEGSPNVFGCLDRWLSNADARSTLTESLRMLAASDVEVKSHAAACLLDGALNERALVALLSAIDLVERPSSASYRRDAYRRLLLWLELLARVEGCEGPVVIVDEAENLYRKGVSRAERRTALRSLGFYCGGALARACVVLALTPETLESLREEASALLDEIEMQVTSLPQEDIAMLRHRLLRVKPIEVRQLSRDERLLLAERVRALHARVRGDVHDEGWAAWLTAREAESHSPRELVRRCVERLESLTFQR
jgi:hypothetical protein